MIGMFPVRRDIERRTYQSAILAIDSSNSAHDIKLAREAAWSPA